MRARRMMGMMGALLMAAVVWGCQSFNSTVFYAEKTAVDTATGATHTFNQYYAQATNGASVDQVAKLNAERDALYAADIQLARSAQLVEGLRQSYAANSSSTNAAALQVGLAVLSDQTSNIVAFIKASTAATGK